MTATEEHVESNQGPRKNEMEQALLRGVGSALGSILSRAASRQTIKESGGNPSTPEEDLAALMEDIKKLNANFQAAADLLNKGGGLKRDPYLGGETYIIDFTHTDYTQPENPIT